MERVSAAIRLRAREVREEQFEHARHAVRAGRLPKARPAQLLDQALDSGILTTAERDLVAAAEAARSEAIAVDSFTLEEYVHGPASPEVPKPGAEFASRPG